MEKNTAPTLLRLTYGARDKRADCARLGPPLVTTGSKTGMERIERVGSRHPPTRFLDVTGNNITFTRVCAGPFLFYLYRDLANRE